MIKLLVLRIINKLYEIMNLGLTGALVLLRKLVSRKNNSCLENNAVAITSESYIEYNAKTLEQWMAAASININFIEQTEIFDRSRFMATSGQRASIAKVLAVGFEGDVKIRFQFDKEYYGKTVIKTVSGWYLLSQISKMDLKRSVKNCSMISFCFIEKHYKGRVVLGDVYAAELDIWGKNKTNNKYKSSTFNETVSQLSQQDIKHINKVNNLATGQRNILDTLNDLPNIFKVTAPIDIVYTWVDDSDEEWSNEKDKQYQLANGLSHAANVNRRFKNRDELRYSLRSVEMFASFVNHIYIVTANQVPAWLDTNSPKVTVVNHSEIFKNKDDLPTYNSHAIEANLHNINGLKEQYIYLNDDVFFGKHVMPELFFTSNGLSKFFPSIRTFIPCDYENKKQIGNDMVAIKAKNIFRDAYGVNINKKFYHTPMPALQSVADEMSKDFANDVKQTSSTKFRTDDDLSTTSFMYHYYAYMKGKAIKAELKQKYININSQQSLNSLDDFLQIEEHKRCYSFCMNDAHSENINDSDDIIDSFLDKYFPYKSSFEK